MFDHNGDPVSAEEVLDAEELDSYYRTHPERDPRRTRPGRMLSWPAAPGSKPESAS